MTERRTPIPTARLMWRLIRAQPWRYAADAVLWTTIWAMPIVPGLITRDFFDAISGSAPGVNVATLVAAIIAYGIARVTVMVAGMWNDVHFSFRNGALVRRNMLQRIYELPGSQAIEESPGEAISRFREDVEEIDLAGRKPLEAEPPESYRSP